MIAIGSRCFRLFVLVCSIGCLPYGSGTATAGTPSLRLVDNAQSFGRNRFSVSFLGSYATDANFATGINGEAQIRRSNNAHYAPGNSTLITGDAQLRYGITTRSDIAVTLPFFGDIAGWGTRTGGLDDIRLSIRYVPSFFTDSSCSVICGKLGLSIPTGNTEQHLFPRDIWYVNNAAGVLFGSSKSQYFYNKLFLNPEIAGLFNFSRTRAGIPLVVHYSAGAVFSDRKETVAGRLGIAFSAQFKGVPQLSLEMQSTTRLFVPGRSIVDAVLADPIIVVPSVDFTLPRGIDLLVAAEIGLSGGGISQRSNWYRHEFVFATKTQPRYGASVTITWSAMMQVSGGIHRVLSGAAFTNVIDRDLDSIPDSLDACKGTPEDRDGFEDADGCPDYDNDRDGIVDEADGCPDNPEDKDSFEDEDGCPDFDNDSDGVPDSIDACPQQSGSEMYRGCPEEELISFTRTVLNDIWFEEGTSKIVSGAETLDKIFSLMSANPKMMIEIQVHTDNRGSASECSTLSQNRADIIKLYLVSKGVRPERIKALGLGSEFPIADNSTAEGRAKNMRVEIRRTD